MELVMDLNPPAVADREEELIRMIARGDASALEELYVRKGDHLYAYALRITGDPAAAEEAVQETLLALWRGAARYRGDSRAIVWLLGILHHKALNQLRGRQNLPLEGDGSELLSTEALPDEALENGEERLRLQTALARLSIEHRTVLELVFYQGLTMTEAARVCRCPLGTVKSRLNYAKQSLRGVLSRMAGPAEEREK